MAPEVIAGGRYSHDADVYSMSLVREASRG